MDANPAQQSIQSLMRISQSNCESACGLADHAPAYRAAMPPAQGRFHAALHVVKASPERKTARQRPGRKHWMKKPLRVLFFLDIGLRRSFRRRHEALQAGEKFLFGHAIL